MKGLVRLYCLLMLGSFWVVPILNFIFDGFENLGYNIAYIKQKKKMTRRISDVVGKFKRFNALKKFAIYIATVSLMSCMPEKWDMTLSIGNLANGIIFSLSVILTIIYYLKFIKGKVDKNGQLISKSKN